MSGLGGFKFDVNGNLQISGTGTAAQSSSGAIVPNLVPDQVTAQQFPVKGLVTCIGAPGVGNRIVLRGYSICVSGAVIGATATLLQLALGPGISAVNVAITTTPQYARPGIVLEEWGMYYQMGNNQSLQLNIATNDNTAFGGDVVLISLLYNITPFVP